MNGRMKALSAVLAIAALIGLVSSGMTVKDVLGAKDYYEVKDVESTENLNKLEDGLNTLIDNEQAYLDGKKAYEDGQQQLADGKKTLEDGYAEYEKGKADYAAGEAKLAAGKKTLDENKDAYEQGKKDYAQGVKDLAEGKKTLDNGKAALENLKGLMANIANLNAAYSKDTADSTSWRSGFEAVKKAGYVNDKGNLDKAAAKADKANLESAVEAYKGVKGLEENGATPEQAIAMVAASQQQDPKDIANLYQNYDNIMAIGQAVDAIKAIGSDQSKAEAFVFSTENGAKAKDAYNAVKGLVASGKSVDEAAELVVKNNPSVQAGVKAEVEKQVQAMIDAGQLPADQKDAVVEAQLPAALDNYVKNGDGKALVAQAKAAYSGVKDAVDGILTIDGDTDKACAYVDNSKKLDEGTAKTLYGYYSSGAAEAVKTNVDRLQKPTADGGITHDEAVAAVASVAEQEPATIEYAYNTVDGMGGEEAANANITALDNLSKDGGQIDQLNDGRKTIQGYLNQMLDGIAGNEAFSPYVSAAEIKQLKTLIGGSDAQFEAGADAFFKKAAELSALVDSVEQQVKDGQIAYNEGVAALKAGKAKLKEYEDGMAAYKQGVQDLAEGAAKLADAEKQLADGEKTIADGEKELAAGAEKLAEYEDGLDQIRDGLQTAMDTEADPGIVSVAERLGDGFTFEKPNGDVDFDKGFEVVDAAWAYKGDDGAAITSEMYTRIGGAVSALIASIMALVAAALAFMKKYKGALPCAGISAAAAVVATVLAQKAGLYFSNLAGSTMGPMALYAGLVLAAVAAVHAIADGSAAKTK